MILENPDDLADKSESGVNKQRGFTLAELMLVVMMMMVLFGAAVTSFVNSQRLFVFNGAFQQLGLITRQARSLALTGQAQIDYNDYDRDGCKNGGNHEDACDWKTSEPDKNDYTTPLNYGVHFEPDANGGGEIVLFADMYGSNEGAYDIAGNQKLGEHVDDKDIIVVRYEVPESLLLVLNPGTSKTITYSPIFADTNLVGSGTAFFVFGLKEGNSASPRTACYTIHPLSGVVERAADVGVEDLCT